MKQSLGVWTSATHCFYFIPYLQTQKKREALHNRSLHVLRLVGMAHLVETNNAEPHAGIYNNPHTPYVAIGIQVHQWL